ncbi:hypothetical protein [Aeromonas hydrophila]|uniref:hypothetical protein n=1 Tax=Aeromonas hydrophila TaxID=644 RepID=UPI00398821FB
MNSRQRRKQAAQNHNDRIELMHELSEMRIAIYTKHGVRVRVEIDSSNYSVVREIENLRRILEADAPPSRPVAVVGGSRRLRAHQKLAMIAAMAGMGVFQ